MKQNLHQKSTSRTRKRQGNNHRVNKLEELNIPGSLNNYLDWSDLSDFQKTKILLGSVDRLSYQPEFLAQFTSLEQPDTTYL